MSPRTSGIAAPPAIVAIGASAGGIEPLMAIAAGLPADLDAAVFVVVHIPSHSRSMLPRVLSRAGPLPARHATEREPIRRGHIYVAPPDQHLVLDDGVVGTNRGPVENRSRPAIDPLFRSAAAAHGERVIGVILSGSLDDGAAGLAAIRRYGGIGIVQDPDEAIYPSMPLSAIEESGVDYQVPAARIAPLIEELVQARKELPMSTQSTESSREAQEIRELQRGEVVPDGERRGTPATFGCPDCGGSLWQLEESGVLTFRCRVGHAYRPRVLLEAQGANVETGLWQAARALEEQATLAARLAIRAHDDGQQDAARRFERQANRARENAELVKRLLIAEPATTELDSGGEESTMGDELTRSEAHAGTG